MNTQTVIRTRETGRKILNVQTYKSQAELRRNHPEVKGWTQLYQIPRGMSEAEAKAKIIQTMEKQGQWHKVIYQVENFIMAPQIDEEPKLCCCLDYIGDNPPCPIHGDPFSKLR
jgi:hypothetical protein